jgi:hypothetical protein
VKTWGKTSQFHSFLSINVGIPFNGNSNWRNVKRKLPPDVVVAIKFCFQLLSSSGNRARSFSTLPSLTTHSTVTRATTLPRESHMASLLLLMMSSASMELTSSCR